MNNTPRANRPHIAILGRRNAGKSSLLNALTNQTAALVSDEAGTTTDPVYKNMELPPIGPVVLIDTAGIDDSGKLGNLRVQKTAQILEKTDLALLLLSAAEHDLTYELALIETLQTMQIPFIPILNKVDLPEAHLKTYYEDTLKVNVHEISCLTQQGIKELIKIIGENIPQDYEKSTIVGDLIKPGEICVLVTPIDSSAPKGRLILPQVQTIRDILDNSGIAVVTKESELETTLESLSQPPCLVITDAQAFAQVARVLPAHIPLTAFSVLFARYKGNLETMINGIKAIEKLKRGDKVLIAEACTHHSQKDDIGTVKIPNIFKKLEKEVDFDWCRGANYPDNLESYKLIIHCGACMLNRQQMMNRIKKAERANVPITNYGVFLAYANGILNRALEPFKLIRTNNT